jgi:hypothetical protein
VKASLVAWVYSVAGLLAATAAPVHAQTALPRGDAAGMIAWQAADARSTDTLDRDDWASSFFGGASAGVYWTPHLKSELDFGVSTTADSYNSRRILVGGLLTYQPTEVEFSRRTIGISQQYQFYENAWFHPHVAAGLHVTWERRTEHFFPAYVFDPATGRTTAADTGGSDGPTTTVTLRPFVAGGFKAYMTPRWFFRADSRFAFRRGFEESQVRLGFGRDW